MTRGEAINWIINLTADIGKVEHRDLWHYEQALEEIRDMIEAMPSADVDLEGYSDNRWKAAYERGKRHGIITCGECVHLHDNDCPMLCGRQLDDYCSWAERI